MLGFDGCFQIVLMNFQVLNFIFKDLNAIFDYLFYFFSILSDGHHLVINMFLVQNHAVRAYEFLKAPAKVVEYFLAMTVYFA